MGLVGYNVASLAINGGAEVRSIVFLSGLSGAGKTTTAAAFAARHSEFKHVVASALIQRGGASIRPAGRMDVENNQQILIQEFPKNGIYIRINP